jgi:hypothetical protein
MKSQSLSLVLALAVATTTAGCFFLGSNNQQTTGTSSGSQGGSGGVAQGPGGGSGVNGGSGGSGGATSQDLAQYEALEAELDKNRIMFLPPGASNLAGITTHLFWMDFDNFDPGLHSYETTASLRTDYSFGIGDADSYNYRASEQLVVTAENNGDNCVFHVYAIDKTGTHLGDLLTDEPGDGVNWWSYSPDQGNLYYVTEESDTALWEWTPGGAAPTQLLTLEGLGVDVGEFEDFVVDSGVMVFIESGRIWSLNLTTMQPVWLGNMTEASGAITMSDGVLFSAATGPFFYSYTTKTLRDIAAAIASSGYELNSTFASAGLYDQDLTSYNHIVGYTGESGLFTFDMDSGKVAPLLLDALDDSTVYESPVFLSDGTVFVQGLQSNEGDIGADGPIYELANKL